MAARRQIETHNALRGLAALLVVLYHLQFGAAYKLPFERATPLFTRGYLMVDLFFVLSGFIISHANRADEARSWPRGQVRRFLIGRVCRLYPLHIACLAALVLFNALVAIGWPPPDGFDAHSLAILASQVLLVNAWIPGFEGWNIPSWSISAEAAAYLLFPVLALGLARAPRLVGGAMLIASLAFYAGVAAAGGSLDLTVGLGPLRCLAGFSIGMLIFRGRHRLAALPLPTLSVLQGSGLLLMLATLAVPLPDVLVIPAAALLVGSTWTDRGPLARMLSPRPFQWLGEISYSIYLNHVGIVMGVGFVWERVVRRYHVDPALARAIDLAAVLALTLAVSTFTYRRIEAPARAWLGERLLHRRLRPIEATPAAP